MNPGAEAFVRRLNAAIARQRQSSPSTIANQLAAATRSSASEAGESCGRSSGGESGSWRRALVRAQRTRGGQLPLEAGRSLEKSFLKYSANRPPRTPAEPTRAALDE
jgi:hypothetical protein